ncbi:putative BPI/LBP family protein At1g04970 [Impatiens glandulifera]|uniref:putative BPI/LBP family protein At1g04970 n=1 Tax=Impatiens glandulifera TaxID=253017 RepID=UPI001FB111DE|nr:putative BPI/LBP family protein At1g04970 [Impatiens glandulifera]
MTPTVFFLGFLFLSNFHLTHVQSDEQGFISIDLFQKGIDFGKDLIIKKGVSSLTPLELPQIEKAVKIKLIGTVHLTLSDINLYKVDVSSSTVQPGENGLVLIVSGAKASLSMNWGYKYGTLIVISDKGTASVQVESMDISLTLNGKNQEGNLNLSLTDCGCKVNNISIKLDGGASWLYQIFVEAFEKKIRSAIEVAITKQIQNIITDLNPLLQTIPKEIRVDKISSINVTFVNDPVLDGSSIGVAINGLLSAINRTTGFDHRIQNIQSLSSCGRRPAKMGGISIHQNVLNSASAVYFNAGVMHLVLDKLPEQYLLNTAEWKYIIPQLYKKYPNADMILNISISSPPILSVSHQSIDATIYADITVGILDAGERVPVACISSLSTISCYPDISRDNITGSIKLNDFNMFLNWSNIGVLHMDLLQPFTETLLRTVAVPYLNLIFYWGLPLPTFKGYTLSNAKFSYVGSSVLICTNVHQVKKRKYYPVADQ